MPESAPVDEATHSAIRTASASCEPADIDWTAACADLGVSGRTPILALDSVLDVDDLLRAMHFLRC